MPSTPVRPPLHILLRLQRDWERLARSRRAVDHAAGWRFLALERGPELTTLDDVLRRTGYGVPLSVDTDHALAELVRLATTDQLAARIVLQRLLPGISSLARRRAREGQTHQDTLDEVVASAWTVIRTYPVDRRPTYVAAGMLREIEYQSFRRATRRLATFIPRPVHAFELHAAADDEPTAAEELDSLLRDAEAAGLDPADLDLARRLGRGESTKEIAAATNVTDRTVRNKREALTYRLRAVALSPA
jgi:DNA-directed RNA polymerase specialized sigma24 family protein